MEQKIIDLIDSNREGSYWDFKESHHTNKVSLLHDILAMANSVTKSDKYIIFGVSDPSSGCEIKGLDSNNRRSQTDIIDFLRSKHFAGDNRPEIELKTIEVDNKFIDVLVIFDHPQKPYYIIDDYRDKDKLIRANYIYSRNLDTNTPINKNADIWHVEKMWRERFGLDLQPAERITKLLNKPEEWDEDIGNKEFSYHKFHPEYQVQFKEPKEFTDVYSYFYINKSSLIGTASFRYHNTELFSLPYIFCDEMRIQLADSSNGCVRVSGREVWYKYYVIESRQGAFLNFITNGELSETSRDSMSAYVMYRDENERKNFENYISNNLDKLDAIDEEKWALMIQNKIEQYEDNFVFKPVEMVKIVTLFEMWRQSKN